MWTRRVKETVLFSFHEPVNGLENGWEFVDGYTLPKKYRPMRFGFGNLFCTGEKEFLEQLIKRDNCNVYYPAEDYPFDVPRSCIKHGLVNTKKLLKLKYGKEAGDEYC